MPAAERMLPSRPLSRTPWGTITREQIVSTALRAIRTGGGYEQMTIRSLAADMGVSPMSLYRHVRDKDDLLDEVVDRLLARAWRPRADPADWKAWLVEAADRLRRFLVSQPAALHVFLAHPVVSPAAVARMDASLAVLRAALGDEQAAQRAYAAIQTYTVGFSALESSRARSTGPRSAPAAMAGSTSEAPATTDRPSAREDEDLADRLAAYTTPLQFTLGLEYLLDGIARRQPAHRRPRRP